MPRFVLLALVLATAVTAPAAGAQEAPALRNEGVPALDLQRYAGQWHEIAHLPLFFQRNCVSNVTAEYTPRPDGTVGVRNACDKKDGARLVAEGVARRVAGQPGTLQVRFAPDWLGWVPMVWADYRVIELDPDYQWAVVGGEARKYLWILSRSPTMPRAQFEAIRQRAAQRGYAVDKLVLAGSTVD